MSLYQGKANVCSTRLEPSGRFLSFCWVRTFHMSQALIDSLSRPNQTREKILKFWFSCLLPYPSLLRTPDYSWDLCLISLSLFLSLMFLFYLYVVLFMPTDFFVWISNFGADESSWLLQCSELLRGVRSFIPTFRDGRFIEFLRVKLSIEDGTVR